jgi:hypothetical protein
MHRISIREVIVVTTRNPSRINWLTVMWLVLVAGQAIVAVAAIVQVALVAVGSPIEVRLPLADVGGVDDAGKSVLPGRPADQVTVGPDSWIPAWIKEPTTAQSLLGFARNAPTILVVAAMLTVLLRVVRNARHEDPFTMRNVRLLRILGIIVLIGGPLAEIAEAAAQWALTAPLVDGGEVGGFVFSGWWLVGVAFLAIAEVVNKGVTMRTELDGVI